MLTPFKCIEAWMLDPARSVSISIGKNLNLEQIRRRDMQGIAHHLIDICDPTEDYSAGRFFTEARAATEEILSVCLWIVALEDA